MLDNYELIDRYRRESGRVVLTGTQALVRIPLMQRTMDEAAGLDTAGFISGYRGSPLGMVDLELWRAKRLLEDHRIELLPAVNEDLAATAVLCFILSWNDFFFALVLTRTQAMTAPVAIVNFMQYEGWEWGKIWTGGSGPC